jgi:2-oxoglutarate ferredoxin oxidoreductase subunit alpha
VALPDRAIQKAAETAKLFLSVEMSMGQMIDDVKLALDCSRPVHFFGTPAVSYRHRTRCLNS